MDSEKLVEKIIKLALDEDTEDGDITTETLLPKNIGGRAAIIARQEGILCGAEVVRMVFLTIDPTINIEIMVEEGKAFKAGDTIMVIMGRVNSILKGERTALNFISRLSGITMLTTQFVNAVKDSGVIIKDTRKTYPGNRMLEKYAVYVGGAKNHRPNLAGGILIKDTHIRALTARKVSIKEALEKARVTVNEKTEGKLAIEIECNTSEQVSEAIEGCPDIIMLDNMPLEEMKKAIDLIPDEIEVEASGNITLENVKDVALSGVNSISVGAITHSALALDFSLKFV